MTDTAQLPGAAENVALDDAAHAFKVSLGQADERPRDERGRFAPTAAEEEEDSTVDDAAAPVAEEETGEDDAQAVDDDQAADEDAAQSDPVDLPASWSKDDAELWSSLPAEAQAKIAEREAQRDAAVNAKFQEAANVRKANEAIVTEANDSRKKALEATEMALSLIQPQRPNPQEYWTQEGFDQASFAQAQYLYEQHSQIVGHLQAQREEITAQQEKEARDQEAAAIAEIERHTRPGFLADVPDLTDPGKAPQALNEIVAYAVKSGIPPESFSDPDSARTITSAQLHLVWKAMQYDKQREAQAKVKTTPKPEAKKPQPVVKPGVAAPRVAKERAQLSGAFDRLSKSGSVEDGAAIFKQLMKGSR